jgi:hypothetical protein
MPAGPVNANVGTDPALRESWVRELQTRWEVGMRSVVRNPPNAALRRNANYASQKHGSQRSFHFAPRVRSAPALPNISLKRKSARGEYERREWFVQRFTCASSQTYCDRRFRLTRKLDRTEVFGAVQSRQEARWQFVTTVVAGALFSMTAQFAVARACVAGIPIARVRLRRVGSAASSQSSFSHCGGGAVMRRQDNRANNRRRCNSPTKRTKTYPLTNARVPSLVDFVNCWREARQPLGNTRGLVAVRLLFIACWPIRRSLVVRCSFAPRIRASIAGLTKRWSGSGRALFGASSLLVQSWFFSVLSVVAVRPPRPLSVSVRRCKHGGARASNSQLAGRDCLWAFGTS